jgi:hypothetical protein
MPARFGLLACQQMICWTLAISPSPMDLDYSVVADQCSGKGNASPNGANL